MQTLINKKIKILTPWIFSLVFLLVYAPVIEIYNLEIGVKHILYILLSWAFLGVLFKRGVSVRYIMYLLLFLLPFIWFGLVSSYTGNFDRSIFVICMIGLSVSFSVYAIAAYTCARFGENGGEVIIVSLYAAGVVHAIIMIADFAWAPFGSALRSIIPLSAAGEQFVSTMMRAPGLTSGGGDALSAIQGLMLVFGIYYLLLVRRRASILAFLFHGVAFSLLLVSIILSARTGFVVAIVGIAAILLKLSLSWKGKNGIYPAPLNRLFVIVVSVSIVLLVIFIAVDHSRYHPILMRAAEPVVNFLEDGELSTRSTDVVFGRMMFLPESPTQIMFGDGNFGRSEAMPYIDSDSGYVRLIHGGGILGLVLMLVFYAFVIFASFLSRKRDEHLAFLTTLAATTILIMNIKVLHIGGYRETFIVMSLLFAASCTSAIQSRRADGERKQLLRAMPPVGGAA